MKIFEVNTPASLDQFFLLPSDIYKNDKNWVIQLGSDIEHVFSDRTNSMFNKGGAKRWIVYDDWNIPAGRIAAFYHDKTDNRKMGGFGFFECVENYKIAECLLNTARDWLKEQECTMMEGPINFGDKDRYWGLLTDGFEEPGLYLENYNPPYYKDFFKQFELKEKDTILTFKVDLEKIPFEKGNKVATRLATKEQITFKPFSFEYIAHFARDIHSVYKNSFDDKSRFAYLSEDDITKFINNYRSVIGEELIWLAYKNETPIGLLVFMKDLNQSLNLSRKQAKTETNLKGFVLSVIPEFQKKGIELGLFNSLCNVLFKKELKHILYFAGINAKTLPMVSLMNKMNAICWKTHTTFNYNI